MRFLAFCLRQLKRHRSYSIINVGGLALSLAACLFIFYFVYDEYTYDRFHEKSDRIYRVTQLFKTKEDTQNLLWTHQKIGPYLKRNYPQVEEFVRIEDVEATFPGRNKESHSIVKADPSIFHVFNYPLIEGNPDKALLLPNSIVIAEELAIKYFNGNALGRSVEIGGEVYEVTGVMKDVPANTDKWISGIASGNFGGEEDEMMNFTYQTYFLLREGENPEYIRQQLPTISGTMHRSTGDPIEFGFDMQPLQGLHFFTGTGMDNPKGNEANTRIVAIVAVVLLFVALFNFINLTTVTSLGRSKEVGVRKVAGARNAELVRQFLGESAVSVIIAAVLSLIIVTGMSSLFTAVTGKVISLSNAQNVIVLLLILLLLVITSLISSVYPAWILSSFRPVKALKNEKSHLSSGMIVRKILTSGQFALSTALLVFLATVLFQTDFMRSSDPGFNRDKVLVVDMPDDSVTRAHSAYYIEELRKLPSIAEVGFGGFGSTPGTTNVVASPMTITVDGMTRESIVPNITADRHYTSILGLNAIEGSSLHTLEGTTEGKAVINESFARLAGWKNPIGEKLKSYAGEATVVGIIPDFHFKSLHNQIEPLVITGSYSRNPDVRHLFLKITSNDIDDIRATWQRILPDHPFEYSFLTDSFDRQYQSEKTLELVFTCLTILTIVISGSGLLGLTIHHVDKKTKEISIRKVLGAGVPSLIKLLSRQFMYLTMIGVLPGCAIGWFIARRWLSGFAYHIDAGLQVTLLPVAVIALLSLLILTLKTYQGTTRNPTIGLTHE